MARKKQEIALQVEIETQEEWEEMLAKEGLTVVDVYQEWCGPCKAMASIFRRIKNEIGDDLLHFAVAKADTVDALEKYRAKCKPCFLFFAGGVLVGVIRGANSPVISKSITEQLNQEHKVLDGSAERKEIRDTELGEDDREKGADDEDETEEDLGGRKKGVTVAIIKPDVVAAGKVDEIINEMQERGIEILEQQEKQLTEEEAREFYEHKQDEEFYEDLVKFMSSGPSHILILTKGETGEGIIEEWRNLLGPASVEEAKEQAPESLRAKYGGEENYVNAVHGSDTTDTAMKELAFFFPDFHVPSTPASRKPSAKPRVQRTLALIRPDALRDHKDEILQKIEESGFTVAMQKIMQLTKEQAERFYEEHRGQEYFEELTTTMSSGPLMALALAREDAVSSWREKLGPKELEKAKEEAPDSFRAQYVPEGDLNINQFHGSDSLESAQKELEYFFPMQQTIAAIKPDAFQTKDEIMSKIREAGFHIAARKETELTKDIAEQFYGEHKDKEYFGDLTEHMTSGTTLFMVLSREDAVDGWRSLMGPTDPSSAKESSPESLRAQYGHDIRANALHGSSNEEQARQSIKLVFGEELEFNPDGTVKGSEQIEETDQESDQKLEQEADQTEEQESEQQQEQDSDQQQEQESGQKQDSEQEDLNKSEEEKAENESLEKGEEGGEQEEKKEGEEQPEESTEQEKESENYSEPQQEGGQTEAESEQTTADNDKAEGEKTEEAGEEQQKEEEPSGEDKEKDAEPAGEQKQEQNEEQTNEATKIEDQTKDGESAEEIKEDTKSVKGQDSNGEADEVNEEIKEDGEKESKGEEDSGSIKEESDPLESCAQDTNKSEGGSKPGTPAGSKPTSPTGEKAATPVSESKSATPAPEGGEEKPATPAGEPAATPAAEGEEVKASTPAPKDESKTE